MTKKQNDKTAETPDHPEKGRTMGDAVLTVYDDIKSAEGVQALAKAGNAVLVSAGGCLLLVHKKVADFVNERLAKKAENIPPENRQPPDPMLAAKIIPALNAAFGKENLREMFLNLLAAAMNKTQAGIVLPAFVEVIKQLSPDEALIFRHIVAHAPYFPVIDVKLHRGLFDGGYSVPVSNYTHLALAAKCQRPESACVYADNLSRLGLIAIHKRTFHDKNAYLPLEACSYLERARKEGRENKMHIRYIRKAGGITHFGSNFARVCILD